MEETGTKGWGGREEGQPAGDEATSLSESDRWIDRPAIFYFLPFSCCGCISMLSPFICPMVCIHTRVNQTHRSIATVWGEKAERKSF